MYVPKSDFDTRNVHYLMQNSIYATTESNAIVAY